MLKMRIDFEMLLLLLLLLLMMMMQVLARLSAALMALVKGLATPHWSRW
jgi:hypothetical protein